VILSNDKREREKVDIDVLIIFCNKINQTLKNKNTQFILFLMTLV